MSSITVHAGFVPTSGRATAPRISATSARPSTSLRLTRRGRIVLVLLFTMLVLSVMALRGGLAVASLQGGAPEPVRVIQVQPGDTLYAIAGSLAQPGEVRDMVLRIQELNSLPDDGSLEVGMQLAVPRD